MSHYNAVKTKLKDPDLIIDALKAMGLNGVYHEDPITMRGWNRTRSEANIVVPGYKDQSYLNYDLGFLECADGTYTLIIEDIDANNYLSSRERKFSEDFMIQYGLAAARKALPDMEITDTMVMPDGSLRCHFEVETEAVQSVSVGI